MRSRVRARANKSDSRELEETCYEKSPVGFDYRSLVGVVATHALDSQS